MRTLGLITKTALLTLLIIIVFTIATIVVDLIWMGFVKITPLPNSANDFPIFPVLIIAFMFIPPSVWRFKKHFDMKASRLINAPLAQVWDAIYPREREDFFVAGVEEVKAVPGNSRAFQFIYTSLFEVEGNDEPYISEVLVTDVREQKDFSYEYDIPVKLKSMIKGRAKCSYTLEKVGGATQVINSETLESVSNFGYFMFKIKNPADDALAQLAAFCEGTPDTSFTGKAFERIKIGQKPRLYSPRDAFTVLATIFSVFTLLLWGVFKIFPFTGSGV